VPSPALSSPLLMPPPAPVAPPADAATQAAVEAAVRPYRQLVAACLDLPETAINDDAVEDLLEAVRALPPAD
jgi:hypothetical protein